MAAALAVGWAVIRSWDIARAYFLPRPIVFTAAVLLSVVAALCGAASWAVLSAEAGRRAKPFIAFISAQPTKYLPLGGALQFATVVSLSASREQPHGPIAATFILHAVLCASAALALGSAAALTPGLDPLRRIVTVTGVLAWLVLLPSIRALLQRLTRRWPRALHDALGCSSSRLVGSFAWCAASLMASGAGLVLLLHPAPGWSDVIAIASAWMVAWAVGFVALPFPSGVGVRELVLALLLPGLPAAAIVAASLAHRTTLVLAELILMAFTWRRAYGTREEVTSEPPEEGASADRSGRK